LNGTATATNISTGATTNLNLIDPDAMTHDRNGNLVLNDETQNQLIFVHNPGTASQSQSFLSPTTAALGSINLDETVFPNGTGFLLATDQTTGVIYKVQGPFTAAAYSASPDNGLFGSLDLGTGQLTPIDIGIGNVHGMAFVSAVPEPSSIVPRGSRVLGCDRMVPVSAPECRRLITSDAEPYGTLGHARKTLSECCTSRRMPRTEAESSSGHEVAGARRAGAKSPSSCPLRQKINGSMTARRQSAWSLLRINPRRPSESIRSKPHAGISPTTRHQGCRVPGQH
jgi:hypothetical protein